MRAFTHLKPVFHVPMGFGFGQRSDADSFFGGYALGAEIGDYRFCGLDLGSMPPVHAGFWIRMNVPMTPIARPEF